MSRPEGPQMEATMAGLSYDAFLAALVLLAVALVAELAALSPLGSRLAMAGPSVGGASVRQATPRNGLAFVLGGFAFLTLSLALRAAATHHGPFTSMFEFSVAFAWGVTGLLLVFQREYQTRSLTVLVLPVALGLLGYALTTPSDTEPLVPALQNQLLLTTHVAIAVIAYGAFTVAFGAAVLYLVQGKDRITWLPRSQALDEISYRAVVVGFPLLALTILLGAIWAEIAWGTYWSWDPKETASLATWLIYGAYLHARVVREWRGKRSAVLVIGGFAAMLFTYYGNLFFGGMHGYA